MDIQPPVQPQNTNTNSEPQNFGYHQAPQPAVPATPVPQPDAPAQPQFAPQAPQPQYSYAYQQPPVPQPTPHEQKNNSVGIVLQWLSYGLWEWTLAALSVLLSSTLTYFFITGSRSDNYTWLAYVVATVLVLLPFAFVLDRVYAKKEPEHKQGFAAVVLVLNAVIVFLAAIGGLITMVVSALSLIISANPSSRSYVAIVSSLVVSSLGLMLFLRIMNFPKIKKFTKLFPFIIVGITGITTLLALAGPFRAEAALKNDRLIEGNLQTVNQSIQDYARKNKKLPSSLSELDFSESYRQDAKALIDKNLVEYNKKSSVDTDTESDQPELLGSKSRTTDLRSTRTTKLAYELCVTYKKAKGSKYGGTSLEYQSTSYINTYTHKAGRQCYSLAASLYGY